MQKFLDILLNPMTIGMLTIAVIILLLGATFKIVEIRAKRGQGQRKFSLTIDYLMENVYAFFEDILGEKADFWIKSYITNLFVVILIANLLGLLIDISSSAFPFLENYIQNPTGDLHFTLALAVVSVLIILIVETKTKGFGKFLYSYFPLRWTGKITIPPLKSRLLFYCLRPIAKLFDIIISLFIGILDVIGILAKVISLAFRLYGNMLAGTILLTLIISMLGELTQNRLSGSEFPLLVPLIFYLQSALTAVIQAFVFSLLTSIFIKMSLEDEETEKKSDSSIPKQLAQSIQRETSEI